MIFSMGTVFCKKNRANTLDWKAKNAKSGNTLTHAYVDLSKLYLETDFVKADSNGQVIEVIYPVLLELDPIKYSTKTLF
jgi:hypothetical protein